MATGKFIAAALLAATSFPASAGVLAIGSSNARLCYEAAESMITPTVRAMASCSGAITDAGVSRHDLVASYINRGILRLRRGQTEAAIADFDAATALDPREAEAYQNKGAALIRLDNARDALPLFTMALERDPSRPALAHLGRGIASEALGDVQSAYRDYRRAAELEPNSEDAQLELARFQVTPR